MTDDAEFLGLCPQCGERITTAWTLIEYTKSDRVTTVYAECPNCSAVVTPD